MVTRRRERSKCPHNRTNLSEKEQPMRTLALCAALFAATATAFAGPQERDRKSTRLNSSHANISYAVFCLEKNGARSASFLLPDRLRRDRCLSLHGLPGAF